MEVKKGYKQTEVGVIPEDWEVKKLAEIADIKTGPFGSSLHEKDYVEDGTPIITVEHLGEQGITHQNLPMVSDFDRQRLLSYSLRREDIVFSRVGSVDRNSLVSEKEDGWLFSGRLLRIGINYAFISSVYLSYYLHQEPSKQRIRNAAVGQTMASLNTEILKNILVALPPTKAEQTAIANALSDTDALIQSLEKLIVKKRLIKQGAMQELLKPKEGWVVKKLGEIGTFSKGQGIRKDECMNGAIPCIRYGELYTRHNDYVKQYYSFISESVAQTAKKLKPGDILFAGSGETKEEIGKCAAFIDNTVAYAGGDTVILSPINVDSLFLGFYLNTPHIVKQKASRGQGDAVVHISAGSLQDIIISVPSVAEQTRIATILSDMDAEMAALETKIAKYKQIKQGMMQNLLTGKIRFIDTSKKKHNWQINEAVIIAVLTKEFGSDKFPLGRKRYTKLSYLLHKHIEREAEGYVKKAAGPYNPATKYGGSERIAIENKYIKISSSGQYSGFVSAENIAQAEEYFNNWYGQDALKWLSQFKYEKNDTLELWATVDMAVQDLKCAGKKVSTEAVKSLIANTEEWKPKLQRQVFSDGNIGSAILKVDELFNG